MDSGLTVIITDDIKLAYRRADVVYTDQTTGKKTTVDEVLLVVPGVVYNKLKDVLPALNSSSLEILSTINLKDLLKYSELPIDPDKEMLLLFDVKDNGDLFRILTREAGSVWNLL